MTSKPDVDDQLQTFSRICYSPWYTRVRTHILRPERPEYSIVMGSEDNNATAKRKTVIRLLYNSLVGATGSRSLLPLAQNKRIITGLTAILFDQECSRRTNNPNDTIAMTDAAPWSSFIPPPLSFLSWSGQSRARMVASLIEHMLLIDYGFGERPLRSLGPEPTWMTNYMTRVVCHQFCKSLTKLADDCRDGKDIWHYRVAWMDEFIQSYEDESSANDDFSDISLMFYFFWTRRHHISKDEYSRGMTGYDGVLDEMKSEIPTIGTDRLTRKLSVDMNKLIPRYVKDKDCMTEVLTAARGTAVEYGVALRAPEFAVGYMSRTTTPNNGYPRRQIMARQDSAGSEDMASFERNPTSHEWDPTPPPSYNEAMGLSLLGGESSYAEFHTLTSTQTTPIPDTSLTLRGLNEI